MNSDVRWQQRFDNYRNAFARLETALGIEGPSVTEQAGIIQFFEVSFELAWKVLKDFLVAEGFEVKSPREAIKTAFQSGYIHQGELWIHALDSRKLSVHTYDEAMAAELTENIRTLYFPILMGLKEWGELQIKG